MAGNSNLPTENINDVILRLLKLKSGEELDYQTYLSIIKKRLALHRMAGFKVPAEEDQLLRDEFKRVSKLKDKGRFKVAERKTKVSSPPPGSRKPGDSGPSGPKGPNGRGPNRPKTTSIVKTPKGKLSTEKFFYEPGVEKVKVKDVTQKTVKVKKDKDCLCSKELQSIDKKLDSVIESLTGIDKENKKRSEKERKESERKRRGEREKGLEAKPFEAIKKAVSTMLKPFKSVWDIIKNFIFNVILGRIVLKLLDWFSKKENREKFQSIIRFLGDHWPTLLALYLRFGTGLGRFIGKLGGVLIKGAFKIGAWAAKLAARAGLKGARKVAGFLGGKKGKAIATGLGIAADVAVTAGAAVGIEKFMGGGKEEKTPPTQQFSGGGSVKVPKFAGGGFNFKGMLGGAGMGAMFGPLGMLLGGAFGSGKPQEMMSGFVSGEKGVDKVPAMLSDGEFVMSVGAVRKYGVDTLEAMNAAGGGTNIPQIARGITYAAGGGYVGNAVAAQEAWANYMKMNPEQFARGGVYGNFESVNKASRDFMKTFMKTGKPPEWAKIKQKTTRVQRPNASRAKPNVNVDVNTSTGITKPSPQGTPRGGSLSTNVKTPKPNVRGYGGALQAAFAAMEFVDRKNQGQTNAQAGLGAAGSALGGQVGWMAGAKAGALLGGAIGAMFGGVGAAPGAAIGAILGGVAGGFGGASLGGKLADDVSGVNAAKERMSRGGVGGAIKGGFGLKKESTKDEFKNAPKTTIMVDERTGRPFVGHKAMKNGKLTYVRPPKPGTRTTNPLEMLGRMINPNAYKENDQRLAMKNQKVAMVNALERFQAQGMASDAQARMMKKMGGNLKDVQNDLNYRKKRDKQIEQGKLKPDGTSFTAREKMRVSLSKSQPKKAPVKPPVKPSPKAVYGPPVSKPKNRRGGRGSSPKTPSFSASHGKTNTAKKTLGVNKK